MPSQQSFPINTSQLEKSYSKTTALMSQVESLAKAVAPLVDGIDNQNALHTIEKLANLSMQGLHDCQKSYSPSCTTTPQAQENILQIIADTSDLADLSYESFQGLGDLFYAISKLSPEHSSIKGLAKIGRYLSSDKADMMDRQRQELNKLLESVK